MWQSTLLKKLSALSHYDEHTFLHCVSAAPPGTILMELGVASGDSINQIAAHAEPRLVYGFDSFEGLPEDWFGAFTRGFFACSPPAVLDNVRLIKGMFQDTLPKFLSETTEPIGFVHVDCDLYSSASFALQQLKSRFIPGSVLLFDELLNYPGWEQHEWKALTDLLQEGFEVEPLWRRTEHSYALKVTKVAQAS